jgi:hypothetical protein
MLVRKAEPASFTGQLRLRRRGTSAEVFVRPSAQDTDRHDLPLEADNADLPAAGRELFVDGTRAGRSDFELGVVGVDGVGDAVRIEVVSAAFERSQANVFGYDDMDEARGKLHHVNVKSGGSTFVRARFAGDHRRGIVLGANDTGVATVGTATADLAEMDLEVRGVDGLEREATLVCARLEDEDGPIIAAVGTHVYREVHLNVAMIRVRDPLSAETKHQLPAPDPQVLEAHINDYFRQVVATVRLIDGTPTDPLPLAYDLDRDGVLNYEPGFPGDLATLTSKITDFANLYVLALVHDLRLALNLAQPAPAGATTLQVDPKYGERVAFLLARPSHRLEGPAGPEAIAITERDGFTVTLKSPLRTSHPLGSRITMEIRGISGPPGVVREFEPPKLLALVVAHEVAHVMLDLRDVIDDDNLMFSADPPFVGRLRYKELNNRHGVVAPRRQRQWEAVPRGKPTV